MSVTVSLSPDRLSVSPGDTAALTLTVDNLTEEKQVLRLRTSGDLAQHTVLQTEWIHLEPTETFEAPVVVDVTASLPSGMHVCVINVGEDGAGADADLQASATIDVVEASTFTARLEPPESRSASAGRHKVVIDNTGNVPLLVELEVTNSDDVTAELAAPAINIDPAKEARVELRVAARSRYWSGGTHDHPFSVALSASNGRSADLDGRFVQGPRLRPWFLPALVGLLASLLLGTLAWFLLLKPWIEDLARNTALELDELQNEEIQRRVEAMELAAEEASELPLGEPVDLRLDVTSGPASSNTTSFIFDESGRDRVLSITDVIFQNPTGAVGTVELLRNGEVLQASNTANFRDLYFHLVAPYRADSRGEISLRLTCVAPGPGSDQCQVAATILGFVDDR